MLRSPHVPDYVGPKAMSKRGIFGKSPGFETNEVQTLGISWGSNLATARFFLRYIPLGSWWDLWQDVQLEALVSSEETQHCPHFLRLEMYPFTILNMQQISTKTLHRSMSWWKKTAWVVVSNIFYFHPYLGKIPILTNIFQMGCNHQPDNLCERRFYILMFCLVMIFRSASWYSRWAVTGRLVTNEVTWGPQKKTAENTWVTLVFHPYTG